MSGDMVGMIDTFAAAGVAVMLLMEVRQTEAVLCLTHYPLKL
jgi:hypothetical protein